MKTTTYETKLTVEEYCKIIGAMYLGTCVVGSATRELGNPFRFVMALWEKKKSGLDADKHLVFECYQDGSWRMYAHCDIGIGNSTTSKTVPPWEEEAKEQARRKRQTAMLTGFQSRHRERRQANGH